MKVKNNYYSYRVIWSEEDKEYAGLCMEFPSLSWLAFSPDAALKGIQNIVSEAISDMKKNNEPIPEPVASKHYSGKFMVRVPPEVHKKLAMEAAESGISLNRVVSSKLSR